MGVSVGKGGFFLRFPGVDMVDAVCCAIGFRRVSDEWKACYPAVNKLCMPCVSRRSKMGGYHRPIPSS